MRLGWMAVAGLALAPAVVGCASRPTPRPASASAFGPPEPSEGENESESGDRKGTPPHTCDGAIVKVFLPGQTTLTEGEVLKEPELGPQPPPPPDALYEWQRPPAGAVAAARAIEAAIPSAACRPLYNANRFAFDVSCKFGDENACETAYAVAEKRAERIRAIVTSAVIVDVDTCACRTY